MIDSGALLFKQAHIADREKETTTVTAKTISEAVGLMGLQAAGIATQDLALGVDFLLEQRSAGAPWLSLNLRDATNGKTVFEPFRLFDLNGTRVAVIGLTDENALPDVEQVGFSILPWRDTLSDILAELAGQADLTVLLSSYPYRINEEIARKYDSIQILLQAGHSASNMEPQIINNTVICQTASRGKYLGMMEVNWIPGQQWKQNISAEITAKQNQIDRIAWQIGRMQKKAAQQNNTLYRERMQELLAKQEEYQKEIHLLHQQEQDSPAQSSYTNRFIAMEMNLPEDHQIKALVEQAKIEVNRINKHRLQEQRKQLETRQEQGTQSAADDPMQDLAGYEACAECHPAQVMAWKKSGHGKAWQTLAQNNQQYNLECLPCHVTLPSYSPERIRQENLLSHVTPALQGVGCESCHGPAKKHSEQPEKSQPVLPDEKVCLQCHTPDRDDNFSFQEKIQRINCP